MILILTALFVFWIFTGVLGFSGGDNFLNLGGVNSPVSTKVHTPEVSFMVGDESVPHSASDTGEILKEAGEKCKVKDTRYGLFSEVVAEIVEEISCITRISDTCLHEGIIDGKKKGIILTVTIEIYKHLHDTYIRDSSVKERVEHMIESVTQQISQKKYFVGLEEGKSIGLEEGKDIGLKVGKSEAMETVAKNLISLGMDDAFIEKTTGLAEEKIRALRAG